MMRHFEILVEDLSGSVAVEHFMRMAINGDDTFAVHAYKGIGSIPKNLNADADPKKRILLSRLPQILKGYGKAFANDAPDYNRIVIIICDLDNRNSVDFMDELGAVLADCHPMPIAHFCLAIEEGEAWLLGDPDAVTQAYPRCNRVELAGYVPDSICGTWEKLADCVYPGGSKALRNSAFHVIGAAKAEWSDNIGRRVSIDRNRSPSFSNFINTIRRS